MLLVGAGVIMLLEWAFDQYMQSDRPAPYRRRVGGGVFTLLILLESPASSLAAFAKAAAADSSTALGINQDDLDEFLGNKHESDQSITQAFPAGSTLTVDNPAATSPSPAPATTTRSTSPPQRGLHPHRLRSRHQGPALIRSSTHRQPRHPLRTRQWKAPTPTSPSPSPPPLHPPSHANHGDVKDQRDQRLP